MDWIYYESTSEFERTVGLLLQGTWEITGSIRHWCHDHPEIVWPLVVVSLILGAIIQIDILRTENGHPPLPGWVLFWPKWLSPLSLPGSFAVVLLAMAVGIVITVVTLGAGVYLITTALSLIGGALNSGVSGSRQ